MELTQLRYFVRLAETLSFTQASRQLFITQSTLSQSIQQTEDELGLKLFDRTGRKVFLTEAGELFLPYALNAINSTETGIQKLQEAHHIYKGNISVGVINSLCPLMAKAINEIAGKYPDVRFSVLHSFSVDELSDLLYSHKIDFALTYKKDVIPTSLQCRELVSAPLYVAVNSESPLSSLSEINFADILDYPIALPQNGMFLRSVIEQASKKHGLLIKPRIETNSTEMIMQMILSGCWVGISIMPSIPYEGITMIPIKDTENTLTVSLTWLRDCYIKAVALKLMDSIADYATNTKDNGEDTES